MSDNIVHIFDHRGRWITIAGVKDAHVYPLSMIEDVASGKIDITDIEDYQDIIPVIIKEWLDGFDYEG